MKYITFCIKICCISIIPLLLIDGIRRADLALNPLAKNAYLATIIDKMHLLDSVSSPRLILMSGSSMAFGVDSELMSKELEIPVVNAALHFNLGSNFMMKQLKSKVRMGDIVLITLEYITTSEGQFEDKLGVADFYPVTNQWIHYQSLTEKIEANTAHRVAACRLLIGEMWSGTRSKPKSINDTTSVFFRNCFSKNGDMLGHLNNPQPIFGNPDLTNDVDFTKQIKDLNDFTDFAKTKGVTVYFTFPSYAEKGFEKNMLIIRKLENQLKENLHAQIIGSPENSVMDNVFFYDNVYHPNAQGRKIFTSRLIQLLEQERI